MTEATHTPARPLRLLMLGALGVVFGDIGTSPLYALREAVRAGGDTSEATVYGVVSLIAWALFVTVTLKYIGLLLRADNKGEGGILSLFALAHKSMGRHAKLVLLLGVGGAAMFLGDALITPAISVLSAVEGLKLASPAFEAYVQPLSLFILAALFMLQHRGTEAVGRFFGPLMLVWFGILAVSGGWVLVQHPEALRALSPYYAVHFMATQGHIALVAAGAVFLAVTGAEAMYADLGHFGRTPIQRAWLYIVFPALLINYLGQAALVVQQPATLENPFFSLMPEAALLPAIIMATLATIIASQAVITGAFSLAHQAVALGLMPRLQFLHTSARQSGQIYCPKLNTWLCIGVLLLVVTFGSSEKLANAYGMAVATDMVLAVLLLFMVMRLRWHRSLLEATVLVAPFLLVDLFFWNANLLKLANGAWLPLAVGAWLMVLMITWVQGSRFLYQRTVMNLPPIDRWLRALNRSKLARVPGTAIWLAGGDTIHTPAALLHNIRHNDVLHQHNIILNVRIADVPRVAEESRVAIAPIDQDFSRVQIVFGYMEIPDIPAAMVKAHMLGLPLTDGQPATYFFVRRSLKATPGVGLPLWQDNLYLAMNKLAEDPIDFYKLPHDQVVEVGMQVQM